MGLIVVHFPLTMSINVPLTINNFDDSEIHQHLPYIIHDSQALKFTYTYALIYFFLSNANF